MELHVTQLLRNIHVHVWLDTLEPTAQWILMTAVIALVKMEEPVWYVATNNCRQINNSELDHLRMKSMASVVCVWLAILELSVQ